MPRHFVFLESAIHGLNSLPDDARLVAHSMLDEITPATPISGRGFVRFERWSEEHRIVIVFAVFEGRIVVLEIDRATAAR